MLIHRSTQLFIQFNRSPYNLTTLPFPFFNTITPYQTKLSISLSHPDEYFNND